MKLSYWSLFIRFALPRYETVKYLDVVFGDLEALKNVLDEYVEKERK
jgi:hypothetical protein